MTFSAINPTKPEKRGRGRPAKRAPETKVYGMTLRVTSALRNALRHLAEVETDERGQVVSVHDVIMQAISEHLVDKIGTIDPKAPKLQVGDIVGHVDRHDGISGCLEGLQDAQAWVLWWDGDWGTYPVEDLTFEERPE